MIIIDLLAIATYVFLENYTFICGFNFFHSIQRVTITLLFI